MSKIKGFKKGYFVWSNIKISNNNYYLLNGQIIKRVSATSEFIDWVDTIYKDSLMFCTNSEYNQSIEMYGTCTKFVWDDGNKSLKLPKLTDTIQNDILSYKNNILKDRLKTHYINICYPGLNLLNANLYTEENCRYKLKLKDTVDNYVDEQIGYMYLLIKDQNVTYYLDDDIPGVMFRKL